MKMIECIAISKSVLSRSPKLTNLVILESIYFDPINELYYIDFEHPLSYLLLVRFPEIEKDNPQTISVTLN